MAHHFFGKKTLLSAVLAAWVLSGVALLPRAHAASAEQPVIVLITHPRAAVLQYYVTLVRQGVFVLPNLRFVGVYHATETEDYRDAQEYITREKISWITMHPLHCPIKAEDMFNNNACREEFRELVDGSSAMIFNGGPDIPPVLYGRPTLLTTIIETPHRHIFEISLLAHLVGSSRNRNLVPLLASRPDYPLMAICAGMQSLNVAGGGTLVQDIPSEIYGIHTVEEAKAADPNIWHRNHFNELDPEPGVAAGVFHPVRLTLQAPAQLRKIIPDGTPQVLSIHHQAVDKVADDYTVTATSLDGKVIEGIRHRLFPHVLGWQFHPEKPAMWDATAIQRHNEADPEQNFIFDTIQRDAGSRAFNMEIWKMFGQFAQSSAAHRAPLQSANLRH